MHSARDDLHVHSALGGEEAHSAFRPCPLQSRHLGTPVPPAFRHMAGRQAAGFHPAAVQAGRRGRALRAWIRHTLSDFSAWPAAAPLPLPDIPFRTLPPSTLDAWPRGLSPNQERHLMSDGPPRVQRSARNRLARAVLPNRISCSEISRRIKLSNHCIGAQLVSSAWLSRIQAPGHPASL